MSYFGKFYLTGPDAKKAADWLFSADVNKIPGESSCTTTTECLHTQKCVHTHTHPHCWRLNNVAQQYPVRQERRCRTV